MPGYALEPDKNKVMVIEEPNTLDELYDRIFYGIKLDSQTGKATLEKLGDGDAISLPQSALLNENDYLHWFSSFKEINLVWKEEYNNKGHLYMEVV